MDLLRDLLQLSQAAPKTAEPQLDEMSETRTNVEFVPPMAGQSGSMIVIDANQTVGKLAKLLGVADGWKKPVKLGNCWVSFAAGDRLAFFEDAGDWAGDE